MTTSTPPPTPNIRSPTAAPVANTVLYLGSRVIVLSEVKFIYVSIILKGYSSQWEIHSIYSHMYNVLVVQSNYEQQLLINDKL